MTTPTLWWIALMASTIVVVVLAVLLGLVAAAARSIDRHSAAIKTTGEEIAGNTAPIRMLERATPKSCARSRPALGASSRPRAAWKPPSPPAAAESRSVAILAWLSVAYAASLVLALAIALATMLGLMREIDIALHDVHVTRRNIAAHAASLDGQIRAVTGATASAAACLTAAAAAIHRAQAANEEGA